MKKESCPRCGDELRVEHADNHPGADYGKKESVFLLRVRCRDRSRGPSRCYGYFAEAVGRSRSDAVHRLRLGLERERKRRAAA